MGARVEIVYIIIPFYAFQFSPKLLEYYDYNEL